LVIDDDRSLCELIQQSLEREGWSVSWCTRGEDGLELASDQPYDAVLLEMNTRDIGGVTVCRRLRENLSDTPVLMLTADGDMPAVISALRAGACDFITKPIDVAQLRGRIERTVRERYRPEAVKRLARAESSSRRPLGSLVGESRAMTKIYDLIQRVAANDTTVLLTGASGTGKEVVARALHHESGSKGPLVALNCAAVPSDLLESELFGHVRGSFTDATADRVGLFEQAKNGTLFLDEISELPLDMQPKLLRVLQERQLRPVGGNSLVNVQTRIIAATNRDLERQVGIGRFRADLYFRLNVVQLELPPLCARGNDILLLAAHFLRIAAARGGKGIKSLSPEASQRLLEYDWPGNVRELENTMQRAVALAQREQILLEDLPDRIKAHVPARDDAKAIEAEFMTLEQQEQRHIDYVLRRVNGNKTKAAQLLGLDRRTLYRKLVRERRSPG
jgi:two-component system response regulator HydG